MTTPTGWYDDGHGAKRWWDGERWTEHVADAGVVQETGAIPSAVDVVAAREIGAASDLADGDPEHAASSAPRSKLWIAWTVLGVAVVGVVVGVAVFIALLNARSVQAEAPAAADQSEQQAAVATVEQFDEAWQNADCDAYLASTTADFRTQMGLTDCSEFETRAEAYRAGVEDYEVAVIDVVAESDVIRVTTTETYTALHDEDGAPLDVPAADSVGWVYVLVPDGREWVIDELH